MLQIGEYALQYVRKDGCKLLANASEAVDGVKRVREDLSAKEK
jgi:hypothetical protein